MNPLGVSPMTDLNPQAKEMADESMVRNLAAQADAIWPQEQRLFDRYHLASGARILDAGCGTGEISSRLCDRFPDVSLLGIDVVDDHLARARIRCASAGPRARFENRSIFELGLPDASFDLVVCRHVLQAIPHAERAVAELARVTKPGGWIHLIPEDYLMIHFEPHRLDADDFWTTTPRRFGEALGTDLRIGRRAYGILRRLGLSDITVDYVVLDTLRVARPTFAAILEAWRDGYADIVSEHVPVTRAQFIAHFDDMIATILDPEYYAVWQVPVVAGRVN
jgi:ubiquinone/menaquinone biosynthesis C-methylase UbiE